MTAYPFTVRFIFIVLLFAATLPAPASGKSLTDGDIARLRLTMKKVIAFAVKVGADSDRFPKSWLFHHRWSSRKDPLPGGAHMIRETVAGRTTAWVPAVQR